MGGWAVLKNLRTNYVGPRFSAFIAVTKTSRGVEELWYWKIIKGLTSKCWNSSIHWSIPMQKNRLAYKQWGKWSELCAADPSMAVFSPCTSRQNITTDRGLCSSWRPLVFNAEDKNGNKMPGCAYVCVFISHFISPIAKWKIYLFGWLSITNNLIRVLWVTYT